MPQEDVRSEPSSASMPQRDELYTTDDEYMAAFATTGLLQSAASVMEDAPSTAVSDDDNDPDNDASSSSGTDLLESLQTTTLPAMPDEQDRKRFVGCLAAVLAGLYEYDELSPEEQNLECQALDRAYLDLNEHSVTTDIPLSSENARRSRYRRRRYDTLSHFLMTTSEYLGLEAGQVKAFLPMIAPVLVRQPQKSPRDTNSGLMQGISSAVDGFSSDFLQREIDHLEHLRPFLESLTPGSGFRCVTLLLLQTILHGTTGYDARIRHALKTVAVLVIAHEEQFNGRRRKRRDVVQYATRQFESLEQYIAETLMELSRRQPRNSPKSATSTDAAPNTKNGISRRQLLRGIKVGGTAVAAGALFAITGGMAAPVIAGAVTAVAGGTVVAATAAVLTSTAALTTMFGVGGGGLAAYKMQRRTKGLTEFEFTKEGYRESEDAADLFSTICISGWIRDEHDFQRPWGVTPSTLDDRLELLERFYAVHSPSHVAKCPKILEHWKNEEDDLWRLLRKKYGTDPSNLFPLKKGPRIKAALTLDHKELVDKLFVQLGYAVGPESPKPQPTPLERMKLGWKKRGMKADKLSPRRSLADSDSDQQVFGSDVGRSSMTSAGFESVSTDYSQQQNSSHDDGKEGKKNFPKHLKTVWDYQAHYGGEQYTVKWEPGLLDELCSSVNALARDLVRGGTAQILRHTALTSLMTAVALPAAMISAANMIDGTWTLAVERSDEAGQELARSLLFSRAGNRPVTLVGYSFGARTVYACLKELARLQEKWEDYREREEQGPPQTSAPQQKDRTTEYDETDKDFFKYMREPASIVEDVVLMGMPNHLSLSSWKACRRIVAGRLVNCFSQKDWILSLMFQVKRLGLKPVCGTCPIDVPGVENIDVTDLVSGHQDYCLITGDILKRVRHGQPLRSRQTKVFVPDAPQSNGPTTPEKYDL